MTHIRLFYFSLCLLGTTAIADEKFHLDIDDNGTTEPLSDGLLVVRYLFDFSGDALTANAIAADAQRADAEAIAFFLASNEASLDVDGDGKVEALTDGLLIIRELFEFSGDSLVTDAVSSTATRSSGTSVKDYIKTIKDTDNDGLLDHVDPSPTGDGSNTNNSTNPDGDSPTVYSLDDWYGTKIPAFASAAPSTYELFAGSDNLQINGQLEGLDHEPTDAPGAGKLIFNRVYRAFKHGLEWGEQFGVFGSWLGSFGANSIEGGLWVNPKTAGPHYYPTLHLAGVGDQYHACSDVQMGSGLYERIVADKWLHMIQISNQVLTVPGSNIAFDMEQDPYTDDNGIWVGWGWSYLNLDHPRNYKFWLSFIESYDYQGPINGYIPEYFNWVDPEKVEDGSYAANLAELGNNYGTFATTGSNANYGNGNENYVNGLLRVEENLFYVPLPNLPSHKEREYLIAHPQNVSQAAMEDYSASVRANALENPLIQSENLEYQSVYESSHNQLKISEEINGEEHRYYVKPSYQIGFENSLGFVQWDFSNEANKRSSLNQNGYAYVRKLDSKWVVEDGADENYKSHPHQYQTEFVDAPDRVIRAPRKNHRFFSYKERDTSNPEFANWDIGDRTRYQKKLQNGATVTYVWFKFIEQPAMLTAKQNHAEAYTDEYLNLLQTYIENYHSLINKNSSRNPNAPVLINYHGADNPDGKNPHLAKLDSGQLADIPEGFEVGYVPVVISVYHPEKYSANGLGLESAPHSECTNAAWTDTYHPDI